jgi:ketosteroid isomerase-like protein
VSGEPARHRTAVLALIAATLLTPALAAPDLTELARQVAETERAFARSMAERDLAGFTRHLSAQAVFYNGGNTLRGPDAIVAVWKAYYEGEAAPFSWAPDRVDVLDDGTLAHSSGPVRNPAGKPIARFNSIWRQEAPGVWRIVFDRGEAWRD